MDFHKPPTVIDDILKLVTRAPSGRKALEKFLPLVTRGQVKISHYPDDILTQLRESVGPSQPVGACFVPEADGSGVVYLDLSAPLGIVAAFLVHEIVHCLDAGVWEAARTNLTAAAQEKIFLKAEVKAFEAQHVFQQELCERFPAYQAFLEAQYPRARILHERLTEQDIADLYGYKVS